MAKTVKSPLAGGHPRPKTANQGSSTGASKAAPRVSAGKPGGHLSAVAGKAQSKRTGKHVTPRGGSGRGSNKGSLPR